MEEIWKDIEGYEGLYQVSNLGRIKALAKKAGTCYRHEKLLKQIIDRKGYCEIFLSCNNCSKKVKIHRLVAQAFIPNLEDKPFINHIDGNKQNNKVDNLEWVTQSENEKHAYRIGLKKGLRANQNILSKKVLQYDINMNKIAEYGSIREVERKNNYNVSSISKCCKGNLKTAYGYIWKYK